MRHVRFSELGAGTKVIPFREGATLQEVLASVGVKTESSDNSRLTQNGRPATPSDPAKEDSLVMRVPSALHG